MAFIEDCRFDVLGTAWLGCRQVAVEVGTSMVQSFSFPTAEVTGTAIYYESDVVKAL